MFAARESGARYLTQRETLVLGDGRSCCDFLRFGRVRCSHNIKPGVEHCSDYAAVPRRSCNSNSHARAMEEPVVAQCGAPHRPNNSGRWNGTTKSRMVRWHAARVRRRLRRLVHRTHEWLAPGAHQCTPREKSSELGWIHGYRSCPIKTYVQSHQLTTSR